MLYGIMKIQKTFTDSYGNNYTLPEGSYYIPVFEDKDIALEHANDGKYEIVLIRKGNDDDDC